MLKLKYNLQIFPTRFLSVIRKKRGNNMPINLPFDINVDNNNRGHGETKTTTSGRKITGYFEITDGPAGSIWDVTLRAYNHPNVVGRIAIHQQLPFNYLTTAYATIFDIDVARVNGAGNTHLAANLHIN
jgi:hypothetical protein